MSDLESENPPGLSWVQRFGIAGLGLMALLLAVNSAFVGYYNGRIMPGVKVSGIEIGGLTRAQAREDLAGRADNFKVRINVGQKQFDTTASQLGVRYDPADTIDRAYLVGRGHYLDLLGLLDSKSQSGNLAFSYQLDQPALEGFIKTIASQVGVSPADAVVTIKDGTASVQADKTGLSISPARLEKLVEGDLADAKPVVLTIAPTMLKADIQAPDTAPAIDQAKQLMAAKIELDYQDQKFNPTPVQIGDWLSFEKQTQNNKPVLVAKVDDVKLTNYLENIAKGINKPPVNKKVRVENGVSSVEQEGQNGLAVDVDKMVGPIKDAVNKNQPLTLQIPTHEVAFKTITNNVVTLAYGKYIEINLSRQHLWVYQDHNVIYESALTSGATGAGFATVTGLFSIQAKARNRNLNGYAIGYNYNVFVQYWMPFYGNYGLHDASWRSSFGGPDYYYGGSHGCVNLPLATAAFLYDWADVGTPVWVHN